MVIKGAAVRMRRKVVRTLEEFYFFKEPRLQARLDELDKQEFPRALSAVSSELRSVAYVFLSEDFFQKSHI
jgi:hypothetical protein